MAAAGSVAGGHMVLELVNEAERRAARSLEASNSALAAHLGALSDRLREVEGLQKKLLADRQAEKADAADVPPLAPVIPGPLPEPPRPAQRPAEESEGTPPRAKPESEHLPEDPERKNRWRDMFAPPARKNVDCVGIQTFCLCYATRSDVTPGAAVCAMMPSIFVLLFQCFVLITASTEALHPTCSRNEDCRLGMWCAPSKGLGHYTRTPGMCDDCLWAQLLMSEDYDGLTSRYTDEELRFAIPTDDTAKSLAAAVAYCEVTDSYPVECDYLKRFRQQLTFGPFLTFLLVTSLVVFTLVVDIDRQHFVSEMFSFRMERHASYRGGVRLTVRALGWLALSMRRFVLPGTLALSFSSIVLVSPLSPSMPMSASIVLAGLVVILLYSIDNLMACALLSEGAQGMICEALAAFEKEKQAWRSGSRWDTWWTAYLLHRFMAVTLFSLMVVQVMAVESLMDGLTVFRLDWDEILFKFTENQATKTCTNIPVALAAVTVMFTVVLSIAGAIGSGIAGASELDTKFLEALASPILALLVLPAVAFILLHIQYIPVVV